MIEDRGKTIVHTCQEYKDLHGDYRIRFGRYPYYDYGPAIDGECYYLKEDGVWLIGNGEYSSIINYCPYCGVDLYDLLREVNND